MIHIIQTICFYIGTALLLICFFDRYGDKAGLISYFLKYPALTLLWLSALLGVIK